MIGVDIIVMLMVLVILMFRILGWLGLEMFCQFIQVEQIRMVSVMVVVIRDGDVVISWFSMLGLVMWIVDFMMVFFRLLVFVFILVICIWILGFLRKLMYDQIDIVMMFSSIRFVLVQKVFFLGLVSFFFMIFFLLFVIMFFLSIFIVGDNGKYVEWFVFEEMGCFVLCGVDD